jgi:hypothetical protein
MMGLSCKSQKINGKGSFWPKIATSARLGRRHLPVQSIALSHSLFAKFARKNAVQEQGPEPQIRPTSEWPPANIASFACGNFVCGPLVGSAISSAD